MRFSRLHSRPGISLVEVLVVFAMLVLLGGLFFMWAREARDVRVPQAGCQNNLRQLCLATINCADTQGGRLPPLAGPYPDKNSPGTVFFHMLAYVEQSNLYQAAKNADGVGFSVWNANTFGKEVTTYVCPGDKTRPEAGLYKSWLATTSYAGNGQAFGNPSGNNLNGTSRFPASFTDGTSNTIMFAERYQMCNGTPCGWGYAGDSTWAPVFAFFSNGKFQTQPTEAECDPALAQSPHKDGINVGMADGSCRLVARTISPQTWWFACTPNGGEVLAGDW